MGSKHRSASELAQEAQERADSLKAKALRKQLADHPEVKAIDRDIQSEVSDGIKFDRWKREAPGKILSFQSRVALWEQRQAEAQAWIDESKERITYLRSSKNALIEELATGPASENEAEA